MSFGYPILEFDGEREAIIEPSKVIEPIDIPEHCVLPISNKVIERLTERSLLEHVKDISTALGPMPVYKMKHEGQELAVAHPGIGAPFVAGVLEELVALGCRKFIACGVAGVLDSRLDRGTVVVPGAAVRDEGTSYHYVEPAREIAVERDVVRIIESVLRSRGVRYRVGKTWTTDGLYRETRSRIARRKSEGCLTVEMECSALLAVSRFRGVRFGQLLVAGDDVSGDEWDPRHFGELGPFLEELFWLSVEICLKL